MFSLHHNLLLKISFINKFIFVLAFFFWCEFSIFTLFIIYLLISILWTLVRIADETKKSGTLLNKKITSQSKHK